MDIGLGIQDNFNSDDTIAAINSFSYGLGFNILVIDYNLFSTSFFEKLLTKMGCNVYTASSGFEGLELYKLLPNTISLLIINLFMPEMDGLAIYSIFKTLNPSIKVILLVEPNQNIEFQLNLDIEALLEKPIDFLKLSNILRKLV